MRNYLTVMVSALIFFYFDYGPRKTELCSACRDIGAYPNGQMAMMALPLCIYFEEPDQGSSNEYLLIVTYIKLITILIFFAVDFLQNQIKNLKDSYKKCLDRQTEPQNWDLEHQKCQSASNSINCISCITLQLTNKPRATSKSLQSQQAMKEMKCWGVSECCKIQMMSTCPQSNRKVVLT